MFKDTFIVRRHRLNNMRMIEVVKVKHRNNFLFGLVIFIAHVLLEITFLLQFIPRKAKKLQWKSIV